MAEIIPVLLGGDLNSYNIARAFFESYGIKSHVFGRYAVSATKYSSLVTIHLVEKLDDMETLTATLRDFAAEHEGATLLLFGCTDDYVSLIIDARERGLLPEQYESPHPCQRHRDMFAEKADFYLMCDKYGIPYPKTLIIGSEDELSRLPEAGFSYPVVVKPSSSAEFWRHPFPDMKKVYFASDEPELRSIVCDIYASGYDRRVILQEHIPGGDDGMRVLTTYSEKNGRVAMACLGHVMLEEHTPHGIGNHSAIISTHDPELTAPFRTMLDGEGYTGFCNFDIKYDPRDGRYLAFDMNLRQGRSNYYVTAAGANIAELVVRDLVFGEELPFFETEREVFWHSIQKSTAYKYTLDADIVALARRLDREGKSASSLVCGYDLRRRPLRLLCVLEMFRRERIKYKKYCKPR